MKRINQLQLLYIIISSMMVIGCANVVAPQGGPIDEDPPEVIESNPPNYSTNYDGSDIRIFFNEYVTLHNLRQQLLVSPPMEELPEVRLRRRSLIMSINEEMMDSTTYSFFFGNAIQDLKEGNAIPNFRFVVSTGDYVDSLSVRGEVIDAFDLTPSEGVYVMMYENVYDSVPYKELPVYITRTGEQGQFRIDNMRKGEYLMFALDDMNSNYLFDLPDERIAFIDSLIKPEYVDLTPRTIATDTLNDNDTINFENDTLVQQDELFEDTLDVDSLGIDNDINYYRMHLFQEKDTVQRIVATNFAAPGLLTIEFRIPFDSIYVKEYKQPFESNWKIKKFADKRDSLYLWLDDVERDSLFLTVWDKDFLIDSVSVSLIPRESRRRETAEPELNITPNNHGRQVFPYFNSFKLLANYPLVSVDAGSIKIMKNDSIPIDATWEFEDNINKQLKLNKTFEEDNKYSFLIPDSTFTDMFGLQNADTIKTSFKTTNVENYGVIMLDLSLPYEHDNYILQLLDNNKKVLKEKFITNSDTYRFIHLNPGNYQFKLIHDKNNNGKWDTGDYLKGIQPEPVYISEEEISVRRNWDHEVIWEISP